MPQSNRSQSHCGGYETRSVPKVVLGEDLAAAAAEAHRAVGKRQTLRKRAVDHAEAKKAAVTGRLRGRNGKVGAKEAKETIAVEARTLTLATAPLRGMSGLRVAREARVATVAAEPSLGLLQHPGVTTVGAMRAGAKVLKHLQALGPERTRCCGGGRHDRLATLR